MPAMTVPGSITLISDTGTITQTGAIAATAGNFTTSTANQAITLGNAGNIFTGAVSLNTTGTGTATILSNVLNLGTSNVGGALTATSLTGDITESGVLTAATGSFFTSAGNINLGTQANRSEEHTSELQSRQYLVCRLLLEKKKKHTYHTTP